VSLEETIFYYTKNSYLIVNNFLLGNIDKVWEVAELANSDYRGVLLEYRNGVREPDKKDIEMRKRRVYQKLDDKTKAKILDTAKKDIVNIFNAMKPTGKQMTLYRNVRMDDAAAVYERGKTIEIKIISSSSTTPYETSYSSKQNEFVRYEITIPKEMPVLTLDQFDEDIRNEGGEVLLPPMKCTIKNIRNGDSKNCIKIIELDCVQTQFPPARQRRQE